jgi:hypothetical protein
MDIPPIMTLDVIILILVLHFVSDYILQSYDMMVNKGKSNPWLLYHTTIYTLPFIIFFGPAYGVLNGVLHTLTDYFSSRMNNKLLQYEDKKWFYTNMGFDQMVHLITLFVTYTWLFG